MKVIKFKFKLGQLVRTTIQGFAGIKETYGLIVDRWYSQGCKIYEVQKSFAKFIFYEYQLSKFPGALVGKVSLKEIKFDKLNEGAKCFILKRVPKKKKIASSPSFTKMPPVPYLTHAYISSATKKLP